MTKKFEPELGQMLFSNSPSKHYEMQETVQAGIFLLGQLVPGENPTYNNGATYENDTFVMRAYCWCCMNDNPTHPEGCPPNFEFKPTGFKATWYKHAGRGASQDELLTRPEMIEMFVQCMESLNGG